MSLTFCVFIIYQLPALSNSSGVSDDTTDIRQQFRPSCLHLIVTISLSSGGHDLRGGFCINAFHAKVQNTQTSLLAMRWKVIAEVDI
ncbi:hypothetical protein DER46DRAFT_619022 [Fusarium sp. MPI-SDFR-AT-0072]|nr:hypothetical protein DER46DRAFT_619022 [Fusarium sp. MPI-SDFR-AT-0072]